MRLRKPCEHDQYAEHDNRDEDGWLRAPHPCPGGEFLPEGTEIVRDDLRSRFLIDGEASLQPPDPAEVRSYVANGFKTAWSEDYPIAAQWLSQFADLLDALASQVGESER